MACQRGVLRRSDARCLHGHAPHAHARGVALVLLLAAPCCPPVVVGCPSLLPGVVSGLSGLGVLLSGPLCGLLLALCRALVRVLALCPLPLPPEAACRLASSTTLLSMRLAAPGRSVPRWLWLARFFPSSTPAWRCPRRPRRMSVASSGCFMNSSTQLWRWLPLVSRRPYAAPVPLGRGALSAAPCVTSFLRWSPQELTAVTLMSPISCAAIPRRMSSAAWRGRCVSWLVLSAGLGVFLFLLLLVLLLACRRFRLPPRLFPTKGRCGAGRVRRLLRAGSPLCLPCLSSASSLLSPCLLLLPCLRGGRPLPRRRLWGALLGHGGPWIPLVAPLAPRPLPPPRLVCPLSLRAVLVWCPLVFLRLLCPLGWGWVLGRAVFLGLLLAWCLVWGLVWGSFRRRRLAGGLPRPPCSPPLRILWRPQLCRRPRGLPRCLRPVVPRTAPLLLLGLPPCCLPPLAQALPRRPPLGPVSRRVLLRLPTARLALWRVLPRLRLLPAPTLGLLVRSRAATTSSRRRACRLGCLRGARCFPRRTFSR